MQKEVERRRSRGRDGPLATARGPPACGARPCSWDGPSASPPVSVAYFLQKLFFLFSGIFRELFIPAQK